MSVARISSPWGAWTFNVDDDTGCIRELLASDSSLLVGWSVSLLEVTLRRAIDGAFGTGHQNMISVETEP